MEKRVSLPEVIRVQKFRPNVPPLRHPSPDTSLQNLAAGMETACTNTKEPRFHVALSVPGITFSSPLPKLSSSLSSSCQFIWQKEKGRDKNQIICICQHKKQYVSLTIRLYFLPPYTTVASRGQQTREHHWHSLGNGVRIPNQLAYTRPAPNLKNLSALMRRDSPKTKWKISLLNFTNRIIISFWILLSAL